MQTGVRFRAYPTREQRLTLARWMGCQTAIYNAKVAEDRYFRALRKLAGAGEVPVDAQYARFKDPELTPWLYEVPSQILRNGATRFQQAYARHLAGLAGKPRFKRKATGRQSVWLTDELFELVPVESEGQVSGYRLYLGTTKFPLGELRFHAHRPYGLPKSIVVSRQGGRWHVSFCYEDGAPPVDRQALVDYYSGLPREALELLVEGFDRNTVAPWVGSEHGAFDFTPQQKARQAKREAGRRRCQRKLARQQKGSGRQKRTKTKLAKLHVAEANMRHDFAHKTSHALAESGTQVFAVDKLAIKNMTKAPKPKPDGRGGFLPNGRKAKAGLNRAILGSCWGTTCRFLDYKALRRGKLLFAVTTAYSSQECAICGHTHADNRPSRDIFRCTDCGHTDCADHNAAVVTKRRGIDMLLAGQVRSNTSKKTLRLGRKNLTTVGREPPEPGAQSPNARGEEIRRGSGQPVVTHSSLKREAPSMPPGEHGGG